MTCVSVASKQEINVWICWLYRLRLKWTRSDIQCILTGQMSEFAVNHFSCLLGKYVSFKAALYHFKLNIFDSPARKWSICMYWIWMTGTEPVFLINVASKGLLPWFLSWPFVCSDFDLQEYVSRLDEVLVRLMNHWKETELLETTQLPSEKKNNNFLICFLKRGL